MKKLLITTVLCFTILLTGCESNNYTAKDMVDNLTEDSYELKFESLDGLIVKKLTNSKNQDASLYCKGTIESGTINIYYKVFAMDKTLIFTITSEDDFNEINGYATNGATVTLYIEADEAYNGNIEIGIRTY
ncbi:MAG: hypothetical protein R3Y05_06380 [bacterium]